ncbi:MAG: sterol desaturase family protein, partial [Phenylobacterium sp.]|nr:sterol desaturase family protein [Phenylobacterium sp.]
KAPRPRVLLRALFPRRLLRGASSKADVGLFLFNAFPAAILIGWALLSAGQIGRPAAHLLGVVFGPSPDVHLPQGARRAIATVALFLAYEFAYWLDHVLSHRIPALWEFHKVHHTAEVLSPVTAFRVHPVDSLVFANITAVVLGLTAASLEYVLGASAGPLELSGRNAILVAFVFLTVHLQHSHIWISFTGVWGRIFLSPAHHQIHHSTNPIHFNRNFGSCLSIWDWVFGTLHIPSRTRERLVFGAELPEGAPSPHSVTGVLAAPFLEAVRRLPWSSASDRRRPAPGAGRPAADF